MKKPSFARFMRIILTLLGSAIGGGLCALVIRIYLMFDSTRELETLSIILICAGVTLLFALFSWFLAPRITRSVERFVGAMEVSLSETPLAQLLSSAVGLVLGLSIAALATQMFRFSVPEMFFVSISAFVYLLLGYLGASIGFKRWREVPLIGSGKQSRAERKIVSGLPVGKILDTSVIIDGRIFDILKTGFVEGPLIAPQFVLAELRHIADSSDPLRRNRGRRGLDVLSRIQRELDVAVHITDADFPDVAEVDVKLLKLAKQTGGSIVTNDFNLNKVADVTGVKVLNINDLAGALRPVLLPGEEMTVLILREGKEVGQGVGYLEDGTMIVVDHGKRHIGETVDVVVTTVLQTSAGRMIFTRIKQAA